MTLTTRVEFKGQVGFDGTLDGLNVAVGELVTEAKRAGVPELPASLYLSLGMLYSKDLPLYVSLRCSWTPDA